MIPEFWPGGGGWSLLVFSLESLFEDFQRLQNIWTNSNAGLPLVKYLGASLKFYQEKNTDYLVVYDTCWPMVDTPLSHADSSPHSMFLKKRKITIPSLQTRKKRRPYKKVRIHPPNQMYNRWYFQRDICKTPLLMLTTTAISLTEPFCSQKCKSNNITLTVLNPLIFRNYNFQTFPQTSGYFPKYSTYEDTEIKHPMWLWGTTSATANDTITVKKSTIANYHLIPLCQTLYAQVGKEITTATYQNQIQNWGNPFYWHYLMDETYKIYISLMSPAEAKFLLGGTYGENKEYTLTVPQGPLLQHVRYNPETDTGAKNKAYLISTSKNNYTNTPESDNLKIEGLPLPVMLWGWTDWIKKAKLTPDPDENTILFIETDQFTPKLPFYVILDEDFLNGRDPYIPPIDGAPAPLNNYSKQHWYPKLLYQDQSIEHICTSQPGCARNETYMQLFCKYKFYFKWGGCPKTLEKAYDPCLQSIWPTPDNIPGRLEIQNPNSKPETELYEWDWTNDYITQEAISRIQEHTEIDKQLVIPTASKNTPKTTIKAKPTTEETQATEEKILHQFQLLQQQREILQHLLSNRISM